jgi:hypothetical protein
MSLDDYFKTNTPKDMCSSNTFDVLFNMRPSIPVSQRAVERLKLLHELHTLVRSVLQLRKDDKQARS